MICFHFRTLLSRFGCSPTWKYRLLQITLFGFVLTLCLCFTISNMLRNRHFCRELDKNFKPRSPIPQLPSAEVYIGMLGGKSLPMNISEELHTSVKLLWLFLDLCEKHKLSVMLFGSSLLGSYRHHGYQPSKYNPELLLHWNDREKLLKALTGKSDLFVNDVSSLKVSFRSRCRRTDQNSRCSPFINVEFYEVQSGWLVLKFQKFRCPIKHTFPMHQRPFMGRWVQAPKDPFRFFACSHEDVLEPCKTSPFTAKETRSCRRLAQNYPFVFRAPDSAPWCRGVLETLRLPSGELVYSVLVNEPMV